MFKIASDFKKAVLFSTGKFGEGQNTAAYPLMEEELYQAFKVRRSEGRICSVHWFKNKSKYFMDKLYPGVKFGASTGWFLNFCNRHDLVLRKKTNKKRVSPEEKLHLIETFHENLRKFLATSNALNKNSKWGRFPPETRYNCDQIPLPFVVDMKRTYEKKGVKEVWINQNAPGSDKRFCTLHAIFRPTGGRMLPQPKPVLVFRGLGKRISLVEKNSWDPRVVVIKCMGRP